ncbi:unnamed protein product [Coffea canephora]|nr:unnamed protein product [Coffea canephora]
MKIAVDRCRSAKCKACMALGFACMLLPLLFAVDHYQASESVIETCNGIQEQAFSEENKASSTARKLLAFSGNGTGEDIGDAGDDDGYGGDGDSDSGGDGGLADRIGGQGPSCSKDNILVFQGQTKRMFNGIPTYTVEVQNVCDSASCSISNIHLSCGWFSSARLINPQIFRRLGYNDCLVKDGQALNPGESLTFQYANSFSYPLSVSSVAC